MSAATVRQIMVRIEHATPQSPIAVFRSSVPRCLLAVFASTVDGQQRIATDPHYIGTYHSAHAGQELRQHLHAQAVWEPSQ